MTQEYSYGAGAAAGYNDAFSHVSSHFVPFLLRAARLRPGDKVLDVATGTGIAAEASLAFIGASGSVVAADISPDMVAKARQRLSRMSNACVAVEDGQALSFPDETFDAVLCSSGLMFFPEPARGLSEFRRVLIPGGRTAVSVAAASPSLSYNGRINVVLARHVPGLAEINERYFAIGEPARLVSSLEDAGFADVETHAERHIFTMPSFDAFYGPYERGAGSTGQSLAALSEEVRHAIREEVRRDLNDTGGPVDVEVEVRFASGRR
jgi:ubiquinone/menaquinone biosynthesis C-methylase UbiE